MNIHRWPDDFDDPPPPIEWGKSFIIFLEEMQTAGTAIFADWNQSLILFEFHKGDRSICFIRRGHLTKSDGPYHVKAEECWEVLPSIKDLTHKLGAVFGIREYACVVVYGLTNIRTITTRWLAGSSTEEMVRGIRLWDRIDPSAPLEVKV